MAVKLEDAEHGYQEGDNIWVSRVHYETKLSHMFPAPPEVIRRSDEHDTYLVSQDDVFRYIQQNLCFHEPRCERS